MKALRIFAACAFFSGALICLIAGATAAVAAGLGFPSALFLMVAGQCVASGVIILRGK